MATLCPRAENYLHEHPEKQPSNEARNRLATYDDDTQMQWLSNPMIQFLIENLINQILAGKATSTPVNDPKPIDLKLIDPKLIDPQPIDESDEEEPLPDIFDEKPDSKKPDEEEPSLFNLFD